MRIKNLLTRFIMAGALLVLATVISSAWSALTFVRLSAVVNETIRQSQATIDLTTALAGALEREDDALLLTISGNADTAQRQLVAEKKRGDELLDQLARALQADEDEERILVLRLRTEIDQYRQAGASIIGGAKEPTSLKLYHEKVNPLLRKAVATCANIREVNFKEMQAAGIRARDEARNATWIVASVSVLAVLLASVVAIWLARSILLPVRELTASIESVRQGDFERRVVIESTDELGVLAAGFNRMADSLLEYRRSSLGELLTAKTTLEATLNALPDAVFVIDPDEELVAINPPAEAVLKAKRQPNPKTLRDLPFLREHQEAMTLAMAGHHGNNSRTDFSHTLPVTMDGCERRFLVTAVPIPEFLPHRNGAVVVLDDVTDFARLDELRSELIGVASHELKTPLTTLRMNLLLLGEQAKNLSTRQHEILTAAAAGCDELAATIDELLDVTRIEAGQLRLHVATVDVYMILDRALKPLRPRFDDAHIQVALDRRTVPAMVTGDADRLVLVFSNLLTNALKYAPTASIVTISMSSRQNALVNGSDAVQVAVTDQGPGIPPEFRVRVFEKFFRVEHQTGQPSQGVRGTGIGLYLCREIIKAHGGSIRCETGESGTGTCVVIVLPAPRFEHF